MPLTTMSKKENESIEIHQTETNELSMLDIEKYAEKQVKNDNIEY